MLLSIKNHVMFKTIKQDLPAGLVVFLVALPLCLGVALASTGKEANLFSGIIAGVIGGVVVGFVSGSRIGVSGPAAGLITIVLAAITTLGSYNAFLLAVVLAGFLQLVGGFVGAGKIGQFFPNSVVRGMLAAIGLTLILKEIPHAFGYDADFMGDEEFFQTDGENTFTEIWIALQKTSPGAILITTLSVGVLLLFDLPKIKKLTLFKLIPGALIVVLLGIGLNSLFQLYEHNWYLNTKHLVQLPVAQTVDDFMHFFQFPDWSAFSNYQVYVVALTIALVGSLETLLSVEATDKLDPLKRTTPTNRELKAQGIGNMLSGLIGGLPVTQVIVRSSANVNAGGVNKTATIFHGLLLFVSVLFIPKLINLIPLSSLAAILMMVGYKLTKPAVVKSMYKLGWKEFLPFAGTILGVLFSDLLKGIAIGVLLALICALVEKEKETHSYSNSFFYLFRYLFGGLFRRNVEHQKENEEVRILLKNNLTFLNKSGLKHHLSAIQSDSKVVIDGSKANRIDYDIMEIIHHFSEHEAKHRNIDVTKIGIPKTTILTH